MAELASSSSSGTSTSSSGNCKYHVFLSFRGEDTRKNFMGHLYRELDRKLIRTFKDDVKLERGESIAPALLTAIEESSCAIVILSENYASSGWCLDELVKILECRELRNLKVVPIFYNVDPSEVKKNRGSFAKAMAKHERFSDKRKVQKWKDALEEVATIAGWDSRDRDEASLIDEVVRSISKDLLGPATGVLPNLVGMHIHLETVKSMLCIGSDGVHLLGIWGMGGIGKTTIARAIYDELYHQFEGCCFLEDVRNKTVSQSQKELLSEILSEQGLKMPTLGTMEERLQYSKVLIVLDDVGNLDHLENLAGNFNWFGPGSRIIITTRDKSLLEAHGVKEIYEVLTLDRYQSLELFSLHAFKDKHPRRKLLELAKRVVSYTKGLPLALKVLGSFLYNKNIAQWEDVLNKLKRIPEGNITRILKISYDGLEDDDYKDIFMDIACFFFEEKNIDVVTAFLRSSDYNVDIGMKVLSDRSLLSISGKCVVMHDLVRDMGKEVARQEFPRAPGRRRRLCISKDTWSVLVKNAGTEVVEGISLDIANIEEANLSSDTFSRMCNLRFIQIYNSQRCSQNGKRSVCRLHFPHGVECFPDQLRYLYWEGYPLKFLPFSIAPSMLVTIRMHHSNIERLWTEQQAFQLQNLKQIDLTGSNQLIELPDLSCAPKVERLIFEDCEALKSISTSCFSKLSALVYLSLSGCSNLAEFPDVPCRLETLNLGRTSIQEVPSSVLEHLSRLERLSLAKCGRLTSLPTTLSKLKSLRQLDLGFCGKLEYFPEITQTMEHLKELNLQATAIHELHFSIESIVSLSVLTLDECDNLVTLPNSLSNLESLEFLNITTCPNLTELPMNFTELKSLLRLSAAGTNLKQVPEDIGHLSSLGEIFLSGGLFTSIPESIMELSQLNRLVLSHCRSLGSLPKLPRNLWVLAADNCASLETIESFERHGNLRRLFLCCCERIRSIPELPLRLKHMDVFGCTSVESLSESIKEILDLDNMGGLEPTSRSKCCLRFSYINCFSLNREARNGILEYALRSLQLIISTSTYRKLHHQPSIGVCYPESEIPQWFIYQSVGSSVTIKLPPHQCNGKLLGFSVCGPCIPRLHHDRQRQGFEDQMRLQF